MKKYSRMLELNKNENQEKQERAIQAIREMLKEGKQIAVVDLVKKTGLSRGFFYKNEKVSKAMEEARKNQDGMFFFQKKKVILDQAMDKQLTIYKKQLDQLKMENDLLQKENNKLQKKNKQKELNFIKGL